MWVFETEKELRDFIRDEVITTAETADLLGITRQGVKDLTDRGKLEPVKEMAAGKLYLRSEVMERKKLHNTLKAT